MKIETLELSCTGCSACASVCPQGCIEMKRNKEGFYFPVIDKARCVSCGVCDKTCPSLSKPEIKTEKTSFYGWLLSEEERAQSTSGGAFVALAKSVLESGGNVYGAAFDYKTLTLSHRGVNEVGLDALKKSKYIESAMGDVIQKIKNDLKSGKKVLFCGTPCQVSGVRSALKNQEENLLLVDFFCHGVPSSKIFEEYLAGKKGKIVSVDFRPRKKGGEEKISALEIGIKQKNGKVKTQTTPYHIDLFYCGFLAKNTLLRESCYHCTYRNAHVSDVTIGDFWGYADLDKFLPIKKGISILVANTEKGKNAVRGLKDFSLTQMDNVYSAYAYKEKDYSAYYQTREQFFENYHKYGFEKAAKKTYMKGYRKKLLREKIKKLFGR